MADTNGGDAAREQLTAAQRQRLLMLQNAQKLRRRNVWTGMLIGAFVLGMFGYTIASVKQERIMDELDDEARIHIIRGPRTGANS